jgi:hypothetical protein
MASPNGARYATAAREAIWWSEKPKIISFRQIKDLFMISAAEGASNRFLDW